MANFPNPSTERLARHEARKTYELALAAATDGRVHWLTLKRHGSPEAYALYHAKRQLWELYRATPKEVEEWIWISTPT